MSINCKWLLLIMSIALLGVSCVRSDGPETSKDDIEQPPVQSKTNHHDKPEQRIPVGASKLISTYPDFIKEYRDGKLLLSDGSSIIYDSGKNKSFLDKLDHSEPVDIFAWEYSRTEKPSYCEDPGRARCEQLFKLMYGASSSEVQKKMETVDWFGTKIKFSSVNGAADSLRAVSKDIQRDKRFLKYTKTSGTFYWRKVSGTDRLSAHSYGIAIDICVSESNYWKWDNPHKKETDRIKYNNKIPIELVEIFEKHGFIWGGRWYHYDTMHFEFRPEFFR